MVLLWFLHTRRWWWHVAAAGQRADLKKRKDNQLSLGRLTLMLPSSCTWLDLTPWLDVAKEVDEEAPTMRTEPEPPDEPLGEGTDESSSSLGC